MRLELTRRADYAIRASLALARAGTDVLSARTVAADQRIPAAFLPRVMSDLVRAGIATGKTGRSGGYRLARPANQISLLDIVQAVERDDGRRTCVLRGGPCRPDGACSVHPVLAGVRADVLGALGKARLVDLADIAGSD